MFVKCVCVRIYASMPRYPQKSKAEVKFSGPGVTGDCKLFGMNAENQTWVPEEVASSLNG